MKILLVENEEKNCKKIADTFCEYGGGSSCELAEDLARGLEMACAGKYDLIIIGLKSNNKAIKNMISKLRLECSIPLIVLLEDNDIATKVELLNSGADSCLLYDYDKEELLAVASSILRRYYRDFGMNVYEFKNLRVNFFEKKVKIDGEDVDIVAKMYDLFEHLIRHKDMILSKETLFNRVWGFDSETTFSVVEVYVSKLRKTLEKGGLAQHLQTIKNAGYRWTEKEK